MANEKHKGGKGASAAARAEPPPLPVEPPQKILPPLTTPVFAVPLTEPAELHAEVHRGKAVRSFDEDGALPVQAHFAGRAHRLAAQDRVVVRIAPQLQLVARYVPAERKRDRSVLASLDVGFASTVAVALLFLALFWLDRKSVV